jgi:tRNA (cytidine32/uridine32-2'-O)-methyltransferase
MTQQNMFDPFRIVLVNPTHPGNIGATARAMKTMGLTQLYIVAPKRFPDPQATERAVHAHDILEKAIVVDSLAEAIADCVLVFGTSARERALAWPSSHPKKAALDAVAGAVNGIVALVFGREHSGLTNEELELCHQQIYIPANPEYSSLNLAAAVQVIGYELRMALIEAPASDWEAYTEWATIEETECLYVHLEKVLQQIKFIKPESRQVMSRLKRLFGRTRFEKAELSILRGILTAIEKNHEK